MNLSFQLVSSLYEHASFIFTPNLALSAWGTVFGHQTIAATIDDHIIHDADVLRFKGNT